MATKLDPRVASLLAASLGDDRLFFESFINIDDRHGNVVKFIMNPAQEILYGKLTSRNITVKAGQLGITTLFLARGYKRVITQRNTTGVVVAYEEFLTSRLLNRVSVMHERLPLPAELKPPMKVDSANQKGFPSLNSTLYIGTARASVFGRGEPIHYFLGSEVAFWADPNKILLPIEDRVPFGTGEMNLESTPNGQGSATTPNVFFELVTEALEGNSVWNLVQLFWWYEPSYRIPIGSDGIHEIDKPRIIDYTQEEIDLVTRIGWDDFEADERIRWRRNKIRAKQREHGSFLQEFMEDIASCFLSTKDPFYDAEEMERLRSSCYPASFHFANANVWFEPEPTETNPVYVCTVDPGQGKATRSVAQIWRLDLDNFSIIRHEATLSGLYDPISFAPLVIDLARHYNGAKIIPEANGHGMAFCAEVKDYENLWYRTDIVSGIESKQIGWKTTGPTRIGAGGTKMYMITELQALLPIIETHDIDLVRELMQVRYSGPNIMFLSSDDHHDAACFMAATRNSNLVVGGMGYQGSKGWKWKN